MSRPTAHCALRATDPDLQPRPQLCFEYAINICNLVLCIDPNSHSPPVCLSRDTREARGSALFYFPFLKIISGFEYFASLLSDTVLREVKESLLDLYAFRLFSN